MSSGYRIGQSSSRVLVKLEINFFPPAVQNSFLLFFLKFKFYYYIEEWLTYCVVLVSGVLQSDSVIHIHISILILILFPYKLLQSIE